MSSKAVHPRTNTETHSAAQQWRHPVTPRSNVGSVSSPRTPCRGTRWKPDLPSTNQRLTALPQQQKQKGLLILCCTSERDGHDDRFSERTAPVSASLFPSAVFKTGKLNSEFDLLLCNDAAGGSAALGGGVLRPSLWSFLVDGNSSRT